MNQDLPSSAAEKSKHQLFIHTIETDREGQRLDNYLIARTKLPKSLIYNLLRRGKIRVNTKKQEPSYRLEEGDQLAIPLQYIAEQGAKAPASDKKEFKPDQIAWLDNTIIENNDHFMVIN